MKTFASLFFFCLFAVMAIGQGGVISETNELVDSAGIYYLKTTTLRDNGTPFPNQIITYEELGDTTQSIGRLLAIAESDIDYIHAGVNRLFEQNVINQKRAQLSTALQSLSGATLNDLNYTRFEDTFGAATAANINGVYRIFLTAGGSVFARMIRLANGSYRLRLMDTANGPDTSPQTQYNVMPLSKTDFTINYEGTVYSMARDDGQSAKGRILFRPQRAGVGVTSLINRIVKVR